MGLEMFGVGYLDSESYHNHYSQLDWESEGMVLGVEFWMQDCFMDVGFWIRDI